MKPVKSKAVIEYDWSIQNITTKQVYIAMVSYYLLQLPHCLLLFVIILLSLCKMLCLFYGILITIILIQIRVIE